MIKIDAKFFSDKNFKKLQISFHLKNHFLKLLPSIEICDMNLNL